MNEEQPQETEPPLADNEPAPRSIANIEKTFLRLTFWQTILSLAGVFTGAVALYAALNESQAVRQQTAASVWPYVQAMVEDSNAEGSAEFALTFNNVGVGPARMRALQLTLGGKPVRNWQLLAETLLDRPAQAGVDYGKHDMSRRVLAPGELVVAFQTTDNDLALKVQEAVYSGAVTIAYCYCSIFDDCWFHSSAASAGEEPVEALDECPDFGAGAFLD